MNEMYRLVFRGEVLEGQHPAVVRRRLAQAASFDDTVLDKLFSGRPVVVKRATDTATAARFQALFRKAGARLRVMPLPAEELSDAARPPSAPPAPASSQPAATDSLELLPAGTDVLRAEERTPWSPREVDTGGLALADADFVVTEAPAPPFAPDVSHLSVAEAGTDLAPPRREPAHPVQAPALEVAAPGSRLAPADTAPPSPVDFAGLSFEVAPAGAALDQRQRPAAPPAPDISHLKLDPAD